MKKAIVEEHIFSKKEIESVMELLIQNLTTISDETGEYLLDFDGLLVDDKSWNVWNWPQGVGLYGLYKYYLLSGDKKVLKIITDWFNYQFDQGSPPKNVNTMSPILTMAFLYEETKDSRYLPYLENWSNWVINTMPRTQENGLEHLTYGPENVEQLWDDTLMMTVLPLAKIGKLFRNKQYIEEAKYQFLVHFKYLCDKKTNLWYHGWTFEENHNYAEALWARGNCWITIVIPELIEILELKEEDAFYQFLIETLKNQINSLAKYQDDTGLWHTLIVEKDTYLETSASAGFAYGILKSINKGYIDQEYKGIAHKAINGLLEKINDDGEVSDVSIGTGMGENLDYYRKIEMTAMPYGQSLVILCFSELLSSIC